MEYLDTNVLVRYLTKDDPDLAARAYEILQEVEQGTRPIFMTEAVLAEVIYVLSSKKLYNIPRSTLSHRRAGRRARRDTSPNSRKLTKSEEEAIIQYILELGTRSFPPRLRDVEDMANQLLYVCDVLPVRVNWSSNFVKR